MRYRFIGAAARPHKMPSGERTAPLRGVRSPALVFVPFGGLYQAVRDLVLHRLPHLVNVAVSTAEVVLLADNVGEVFECVKH